MLPYKYGFDNWEVADESYAKEATEPEVNNEQNSITADDSVDFLFAENNESLQSMDSAIGKKDVSDQIKKVFCVYIHIRILNLNCCIHF